MPQKALAQVIASLPSISGAPEPKSPAAFVAYVFVFALGVTGIAVFIAFLIGAFRYFFSAASPGAIQDAKDRMLHAFLGFLVVITSIILLYTINPSLLRLQNPALPAVFIPVPSALKGECRFVSAQWAGTGAPGAEVALVAATDDCKDGETVTFKIFDPSGRPAGTALFAQLSGGQASASWIVPSSATDIGYTFEAAIGAIKILSDPLGGGTGGGGLLSADCANAEKGRAAPATCNAPCHNTVNPSVVNPATGQPYPYTCEDIILRAAKKYGVSPALIAAIMWGECDTGDPACESTAGSCGLMQVNTATLLAATDPAMVACRALVGGAADAAAACATLKTNPDIAVNAGACILREYERDAMRKKSEHNYPGNEIQYIAAAYNGGPGANSPSCNCRPEGEKDPPAGCDPAKSKVCINCASRIPRWVCRQDAPAGTCVANDGYRQTREYAATVANVYAKYASCAQWQ